jgi:tetratricopeptide (TPR) repeat protein
MQNQKMKSYANLVQEAQILSRQNKIPESCFKLALAINQCENTRQLLQINQELPLLLTQITEGMKQSAQKYFESQINIHKNASLLCIAGLYENEKIAFKYLQQIIDQNDTSQLLTYVAHFLIGENYINMKRFDEALEPIQKCLKGLNWFHYGHYVLATVYMNLTRMNDAILSLNKAIDLLLQSEDLKEEPVQELYMEYLGHRARIYNQNKELDKALEDYNLILSMNPDNIVALLARAKIYLAKKENFPTIYADLERIIKIQPDISAFAYSIMARALRQERKYQEACEAYDKAFAASVKWSGVYNVYDCYLEKALIQKLYLNNFKEAKETYDKCIKQYPEKPEPYYYRGRLLGHCLKEPKQALSNYQRAMDLLKKANSSPSNIKLQSDVVKAIKELD